MPPVQIRYGETISELERARQDASGAREATAEARAALLSSSMALSKQTTENDRLAAELYIAAQDAETLREALAAVEDHASAVGQLRTACEELRAEV